jgi:hypothetical protein
MPVQFREIPPVTPIAAPRGTRWEGVAVLITGTAGMVMGLLIEEPVGFLLFAALAGFGVYLFGHRSTAPAQPPAIPAHPRLPRSLVAGITTLALMACGQPKPDAMAIAAGAAAVESAGGARPRADRIPATRTLASGATIGATTGATVTSRSNKAGETMSTIVDADVKDAAGHIVIPAGSTVELTITEISPARNKSQADGSLTLQVTGVTVRGVRYPIAAQVTSLNHDLKGRGVTAGEVEKVGVGAAIGAVAGQIIGGNTKGAIIGGAVGAAGGTVVAIETASRDVVVSAGSPLTITLTGPLTVSAT